MAKGKFKKQMHRKQLDLQKLKEELATPTKNGEAVQRQFVAKQTKEHKEHMDNLAHTLFDEVVGKKKYSTYRFLEMNPNTMVFRERTSSDKTGYSLYVNCEEMVEYSERYFLIIKKDEHLGKNCLFFVPNEKGRKLCMGNGTYPLFSFMEKKFLLELEQAGGVKIDSEYSVKNWTSSDNLRYWYIFL